MNGRTPDENALSDRYLSAQNVHPCRYFTVLATDRNTYDALGMNVPRELVHQLDTDALKRLPGVIHVWPKPDELYLKVSGKVLGARYPELISRETIPAVWDALAPALIVDRDRVETETRVTFCDLTRDVHVDDPAAVFAACRSAPVPAKYYRQGWGPRSVSFTNQAKTRRFRDRLAIYDKGTEIQQKPVSDIDPTVFSNVIRLEYRISGGDSIRRKLNIPDNRLSTVLDATGSMYDTLRSFFGEPPPETRAPTTAKDLWDSLAVAELKRRFDDDPERAIAFLNTMAFDTRRVKAKVRALW